FRATVRGRQASSHRPWSLSGYLPLCPHGSFRPGQRRARPLRRCTRAVGTLAHAERLRSSGGGLMGRFTWLSSALALGRFGSLLQRLRRSVVARSPAVRWGLAAVTIVVLVFLGYLGVGALTTTESTYLG